ncbi:MAG: dynamin family protein [Polaromonas sp.]|nr:dynamin family protein [Polaromonas sp.]
MNADLTTNELAARYQLLCRSTQVEAAKTPQIQQIGGHLQALNQLLKHDLRALARRGSPDDFADIYFALEQELERFHEFCSFPALAQKFVVAFGGGFSAGKSSLINTLLGKRLLVTEVDPTTSLPTYLLKGENDAVHAHNLFGHRIDLSTEEFLSLTHDEIERYGSNISRLLRSAFITRADFPWNNLALIDTPGYTKHEDQAQSARTDEHIARTQLNAAQAIVWVIDARKGCITEDDLQFLSTVQADIPRLIVVSRADQKPADEISAIVQGIKATLSERNLPFVDVFAVSARKKKEGLAEPTFTQPTTGNQKPGTMRFTHNFKAQFTRYITAIFQGKKTSLNARNLPVLDVASQKQKWPREPILTQLAAWSQQPHVLRFTHNFKAQFTRYACFIEEEQRQAQRHLNRLNRILVMADSQEVQADAEELKQQAEYGLMVAKERAAELLGLRHRFFSEIKAIGDALGIALPEPSEIDLINTQGKDILKLLIEQREQEGRSAPEEPQTLRNLMQLRATPKISSLLGKGLEAQLNPHIAAGLDAHSRETYARLLAALLTAQGAVSDAQTQLFKALLGTLQLDDIRASLFAQTKNLDSKELLECHRIINEHGLGKSYFLDALILCRLEKPLNELNIRLLLEISDYLGMDKNSILGLISVANYIFGLNQEDLIEDDMIFFGAWGMLVPLIDIGTRMEIAKREYLPIGMQLKLANDEEESVLISLSGNKFLNEKIQYQLVKKGSLEIQKKLAKNPYLTNNLKNYLLTTGGDEIKQELAKNLKLNLDIQNILVQNSNWKIRRALAENNSTNQDILSKLIDDDNIDVKIALAENSSLKEAGQKRLLHYDASIRKGLAANRSLSKPIQMVLMNDKSSVVRDALACNPSIDEEIQEKFTENPSRSLRALLAKNTSLNVSYQYKLFDSLRNIDFSVKINLFENPSIDKNLKEKIISTFSDLDLQREIRNLAGDEESAKEELKKVAKASDERIKYQQNINSTSLSQFELSRLKDMKENPMLYFDIPNLDTITREEMIKIIRKSALDHLISKESDCQRSFEWAEERVVTDKKIIQTIRKILNTQTTQLDTF